MKKEEHLKKKKPNYKRISIALGIIVIILLLILFSTLLKPYILNVIHKWQGEGKSFEYKGFTFTKIFVGRIPFYETNLAIYRPIQNKTFYWTLRLRNDPRLLEKKIESNITSKLTRKVYASFDRGPLNCSTIALTSYRIGEFLDAIGAYKEAAFSTEELAKENNYTYKVKNCNDAKGDWSVILITESRDGKSRAIQNGQCYILEIANCETIETSEKFFLDLIVLMKKEAEQSLDNKNKEKEATTED